ncbi:MAG TPA: trehalose-6-phosphate synthase [Acidimicrobiales bacterium]|nr:trehalose-6-phosphate synthase [Acidimicrobiales bacterium]
MPDAAGPAGARQAAVVVASNRGPFAFRRSGDGHPEWGRAAGGLVVAVGPGAARDGATWVAATVDGGGEAPVVEGDGLRWHPLVVDGADHRAYYDVIVNGTLWYCAHGLWDAPRRPRFDRHWHAAWHAYRSVNDAFAATVASVAAPGATVLAQDWHLGLLAPALRARRPDLRTSLFVHTPWPTPEELGALPGPARSELVDAVAAAGAVGFHTERWAERFLASCEQSGVDAPSVYIAPAAPDADDLRATAAGNACADAVAELDAAAGGRAVIARVDRMELSKNVLRGFWAFDELLETAPRWRGRVVFVACVYPSRQGLADYLAYGQELRTLADHLNAKWGAPGYTPVLLDTDDDHPRSVAAMRRYDVLLVNPLRDGLNLVASEGPLVNERDGTVVLSTEAGAWAELGASPGVVGVNPFDVSATAAAILEALERSPAARRDAAIDLRRRAGARSPLDWWDAQLHAAADRPGA